MLRPSRAITLVLATSFLAACSPSRKELMAELDQVKGELTASQEENKSLQGKITQLQSDIADRDAQIAALQKEKDGMSTELAQLREEQKRRQEELKVYEELFARLKKLIDAGTIKVSFRKGRMIVELASAVLFDSGKTVLKDEGKVALDGIVEAFQSINDRDLLVGGHTDNVPIKTAKFKNNWDLSTARAVVVVDHMIQKGFPAAHLGAAGFADVDPVAPNETEEGKAQNRRIEIVLMPNLGELKGIEDMLKK